MGAWMFPTYVYSCDYKDPPKPTDHPPYAMCYAMIRVSHNSEDIGAGKVTAVRARQYAKNQGWGITPLRYQHGPRKIYGWDVRCPEHKNQGSASPEDLRQDGADQFG